MRARSGLSFEELALHRPSVGRREGSRDASPQGVFPPHMSPEKQSESLRTFARTLRGLSVYTGLHFLA